MARPRPPPGPHPHPVFRLKAEADAWARDQEGRIDKGQTPMGKVPANRETFADLIELHFADLAEVGRAFGRSKEATLLRLKDSLGSTRVATSPATVWSSSPSVAPRKGLAPSPSALISASSAPSSNTLPPCMAFSCPLSKCANG